MICVLMRRQLPFRKSVPERLAVQGDRRDGRWEEQEENKKVGRSRNHSRECGQLQCFTGISASMS